MAHESPLFQSSMELLGHSIEHFNGSTEMDRKLTILHLANAVELLLKDLLLDLGESIYKNAKETITIQGCISALEARKVPLPSFNKMELLIDERNALQHRYGSPNELTTIYYMNATIEFFNRMLSEHYGLELEELLPEFIKARELEAFKLRRPSDESELENLKRLAKVHPVGAFLSAATYLEKLMNSFLTSIDAIEDARRKPSFMYFSHRVLQRYGVDMEPELEAKLQDLRNIRNLVTHGRSEPTEANVIAAVDTIECLEKKLNSVDKEAAKVNAKVIAEEDKQRRRESAGFPSAS